MYGDARYTCPSLCPMRPGKFLWQHATLKLLCCKLYFNAYLCIRCMDTQLLCTKATWLPCPLGNKLSERTSCKACAP